MVFLFVFPPSSLYQLPNYTKYIPVQWDFHGKNGKRKLQNSHCGCRPPVPRRSPDDTDASRPNTDHNISSISGCQAGRGRAPRTDEIGRGDIGDGPTGRFALVSRPQTALALTTAVNSAMGLQWTNCPCSRHRLDVRADTATSRPVQRGVLRQTGILRWTSGWTSRYCNFRCTC